VTVLETIQLSTEFLAKKGVDSPRLHAEHLLAHLLKVPRMRLYLNFERVLEPCEIVGIRELIRRRGRREPLQHILGSASFCGLEMIVNRHVLVPRPETELLAELGWQFLNQLSKADPDAPVGSVHSPVALDYGTGSGCLAVALAKACPDAELHGLDISPQAIEVARQNAAHHGLERRIRFWLGDGFGALPPEPRFDLIICNPPYLPTSEIELLEPEVRDFDPRQALDGGPDGLEHYRRLASEAGGFLQPGGKLMLEVGDCQSERVRDLLQEQNWVVEQISQDYTHRPRVMMAHRIAWTGDGIR